MIDAAQVRDLDLFRTHDANGKPFFCNNAIRTTKYTLLNFIPKNLFHQFSRLANFYFLVISAVLQLPWSPISAAVAFAPLIAVVCLSALREGIENILRWRSDQHINSLLTHKLIDGVATPTRWDALFVGDVVHLSRDDQVPADLVLLSTSHPDGTAYIETASLDGETNLKLRQTKGDPITSNAHFQCDAPNHLLYTFNGNVSVGDRRLPLDNRQVLLRGCTLKNTSWARGIVVYSGQDTKLMLNWRASRVKRSYLERFLNMKLISIFVWLFVFGTLGALLGTNFEFTQIDTAKHWYFGRNSANERHRVGTFFILLVSNIAIINATIPISVYVTLEIVRIIQGLYCRWDVEMYDPELEQGCSVRTTTISDDLGQVSLVFSDKTGTLTQNVMKFVKCSVEGRRYEKTKPDVEHFLWLLATCHEVIPDEETKTFQASSPDEAALAEAAAEYGYVFKAREVHRLTVAVAGTDVAIELFAALEFTSSRKRSSVIIRHPTTQEIVLYCKGSDDFVFGRLAEGSQWTEETRRDLKEFAESGLRTLCLGYRVLEEEFFEEWLVRWNEANCVISDRESAVLSVADEVECELMLLGATAIEDKLQEGVPDAINGLLRAKNGVWIITGDKRETAIDVGFACSLLQSDMQLVVLESGERDVVMEQVDDAITASGRVALVISGEVLQWLLTDEYVEKFIELTGKVRSVICYRVLPLDKAMIVSVIREKTRKIVLAIGDGANDIGMISQADIGVGIRGKEGCQAVLASDYAISQFRFLNRLLFVHGRLAFVRNMECINYAFYKNMACSFSNAIFGCFSSWSGNILIDPTLYMVYNVVCTSAPPLVFAILERDLSMQSMMSVPELYNFDGAKAWLQSYPRFWLGMGIGLWHSLVAFFVPYFALQPLIGADGREFGYKEFGSTVYICVVVLVNCQIAVMSNYWTWMHHVFIWGSIGLCLMIIVLLGTGSAPDIAGIHKALFAAPMFWLTLIAATITGMIPSVAGKALMNARNTRTNQVRCCESRGIDIMKSESRGNAAVELE
jgi:magnesium-transporting ATPase (P-type)